MEEIFKHSIGYITLIVEAFAAVIIFLASIEAIIKAFKLLFINRSDNNFKNEEIRIRLGRWLALALEFTLAADILATAVAPSWDDIGKLAAIIILRTALNYFLQLEIDKSEKKEKFRNENL